MSEEEKNQGDEYFPWWAQALLWTVVKVAQVVEWFQGTPQKDEIKKIGKKLQG